MPSQGTRYSEPYAGPHGTTGFPFRVHSPRFGAHVTLRSSSISLHTDCQICRSRARVKLTTLSKSNTSTSRTSRSALNCVTRLSKLQFIQATMNVSKLVPLRLRNTGNGHSRSALTRAVIRAHNTKEWRTLMSIVFFELSILPELKP